MKRWIALALLTAALFAGSAEAQPTAGSNPKTREQKIADLALFWRSWPLTLGEVAATTSMFLAFGLLAFSIGGFGADVKKGRWLDRRTRAPLLDVGLILAWSFFVRFVLTEPNILTDGGSGYGRVMGYARGYSGLAVLVGLFPAEWSAFMWRAMLVPRVLAAFAPALLACVARGLGFGRSVALIAGLALASLPVHAALTASDLLVGPMSSVQLAGLSLVLLARRGDRSDVFAAGMALAAWGMWFRPEGVLGLLPLAAASLSFSRSWWDRWEVRLVVLGVALLVLLRAVAIATNPYLASNSAPGPLSNVAWGNVLFSTVLVPVWFWLPAPFAVGALVRHRALAVVAAGLLAGLVPVYLRGLNPEPASTHLETLRYGLPVLAWLALTAAVGLDSISRWIAGRWLIHRALLLFVLRALLAIVVVSPVAINHEYLGRRYGHAASEPVIRQLLKQVPNDCGLLVPDDFPEGVTIEIYDRYVYIASEAHALEEIAAIEVRPVSDLLDGKVDPSQCWAFLRGPFCYHAFAGRSALACDRIQARFNLEEIASIPVEFRHHRLVTGPDVRSAPWYMERMPVVLYRVGGRKTAD